MKTKKQKKIINKQKIFCFISLIFLITCIIWYGSRAIYFYLDTRKIVENEEQLLAQTIIDKNYDTKNFKKINSDYYFYEDDKNNYLIYSNIIWRIIKINSDNQITLVTDEPIISLAYGENKDYNNSPIIEYLNQTSNENTGIIENNLNKKETYLMKNNTCIDNITDIKKITCKKTNEDNFLSMLSIIDYINTGSDNSFINNGKYTYLANNNDNKIWYIDTNGKLNTSDGTDIYGVKTTITIKPSTKLISGEGTQDSPYIIEDTFSYFGSYVKLDEDIWRVYEVNNNNLKLVLNDYLKVEDENLKYIYSNNNYYHNDTTYGSLAYYLNKTYLNSLSYKDLIIENKYSNSYYEIDTDFDYKNILTTTIDTKVSIPSITDPILNSNLDNYFINTGTSKESTLIYTRKNTSTLSTTKVTTQKYVVPCITIDKNTLKAGNGLISDPYRTE